jgi:hypothetical protein
MGNSLSLQFIPTSLAGIALSGLKLTICSVCRCCVWQGCQRPFGKAPWNHYHHANKCTPFAQLCQLFFFLANFLPVPSLVASSDNRFFSLGSIAIVSLPEARTMEPVGRASRGVGPGAAGALGSVAPVILSHAPAPAVAPTDFVQKLLRQRASMEPPGGAAKRWFPGRLPLCPQVPPPW